MTPPPLSRQALARGVSREAARAKMCSVIFGGRAWRHVPDRIRYPSCTSLGPTPPQLALQLLAERVEGGGGSCDPPNYLFFGGRSRSRVCHMLCTTLLLCEPIAVARTNLGQLRDGSSHYVNGRSCFCGKIMWGSLPAGSLRSKLLKQLELELPQNGG